MATLCGCTFSENSLPENYIKIFRGDDTNFNNSQWLKILLQTDIDLTGFQGIFQLLGYSYTGSINVEEKSLEIEISASDTAKFPIGPADGVFRLEDTQNRFKTVSNTIPFYITNQVFTQQEQNITLPVPPDYPISLTLQISGGDVPPAGTTDYNKLENLPTFNGTQWSGSQTFQSANIAPLSGLNALEQVVNQKPSSVDVQNAVNGLQEQINTNKNDLAGLGDQVSEIEAKIPQSATEQNQLVDNNYLSSNFYMKAQIDSALNLKINKEEAYALLDSKADSADVYTKTQVDEKIAAAGSGADVDLTGYYNENNLLGGKDIEIVEVLPEGGIDEHTVAYWNFEINGIDSVHNILIQYNYSIIDHENYKFGTGSLKKLEPISVWNSYNYNIDILKLTTTKSLTVDFWLKLNQRSYSTYSGETTEYVGFNRQDENPFGFKWLWKDETKKVKFGDYLDNSWSDEITLNNYGEWHHVAYTFDANTKTSKIYFDGKLIKTTQLNLSSNFQLYAFDFYRQEVEYQPSNNIDEARISDIIRYTENFVPPTKPYSVAVPTGKKQINFTGTIPQIDTSALISQTEKGAADGVAPLGADSKVPAEYLPEINASVPDIDTSKFVTIDTEQTILGAKNFDGKLRVFARQFRLKRDNGNTESSFDFRDRGVFTSLTISGVNALEAPKFISSSDGSEVLYNRNKGKSNGVCPLGADSKVPAEYLPAQDGTVSDEKHGIRADYSLKHGIIECPQGLIDFSVNNKDITINPGIVLQLAGADTQTTLASQERYTVQETGKITLFLARTQSSSGTIQIGFLEAADVFWQEEEPTDGASAYLAWYNPNLGKWQFKNSDTGNVWREAVATPLADINASSTGIISVNYFGYSVNDARNCASLSDIESLEEKYALLLSRIEALENK